MATTTVTCAQGTYTQVTTLDAAYCIISNPVDRLGDGQRIRIHIGASAPADGADEYHPIPKGQSFERASVLTGHIFVNPETSSVDIPVTEAV